MVISGRKIAKRITNTLQKKVEKLKSRGVIPGLAIVTLGDEASWKTYVNQKIRLAEKLGINSKLYTIENPDSKKLLKLLEILNNDNRIHGIIVQRPIPNTIDKTSVTNAIAPQKDIDGFQNDSPFQVPVRMAVERILKEVYRQEQKRLLLEESKGGTFTKKRVDTFSSWLHSKKIAVIGKGETAGFPIIKKLKRKGIHPIVIDSKTSAFGSILIQADVIISAVGKTILKKEFLKKGVALIGVGIGRGEDGKLRGDYNEEDIRHIASYYTPTPGGVGPVNLAYLFKNLVEAAKNKI